MPELRAFAVAKAELYEPLDGDPVVVDHGNTVYEYLAKSFRTLEWIGATNGRPHLEYLKELRCVTCRPFILPRDTILSQWDTWCSSDSPWEEREPTTGYYRVSRLYQGDASPGVKWSAMSRGSHPANVHTAFSLVTEDTPGDWPEESEDPTLQPYIQIEFGVNSRGNGEWCIRRDKAGTRLQYNMGGIWMDVEDLSDRKAFNDLDEQWFFIRCIDGHILISTDWGKTYDEYSFPGDFPTGIRSGRIKVHGQGHKIAFGVHGIRYYPAGVRSRRHDTLNSRPVSQTTNWSGFFNEPNGTTVTFTDCSQHSQGYMRWEALLQPVTQVMALGEFWTCPTLSSVFGYYPPLATRPTQFRTTPSWNKHILEVNVSKPVKLEQSTCTIRFHVSAFKEFSGNYRWRKIEVSLGHKMKDGKTEYPFMFRGYIRSIELVKDQNTDWSKVEVEMIIDNALVRYRRTEWWPTDVFPLGGRNGAQALDWIFQSEGTPLQESWRQHHALMFGLPMPGGDPEDPTELLQPREHKDETMRRIASYYGCELAVTDDGILKTVPIDYTSPTVDFIYTTQNTDDIRQKVASISNSVDHTEGLTAVMLTAKDEFGNPIQVWAIDRWAEQNAGSDRACPWREGYQERIRGTASPWMMAQRAAFLGYTNFIPRYTADIEAPVDVRLSRRMRIEIRGAANIGIPERSHYVLLTMNHRMNARGSLAKLTTSLGLMRLEVPQ